MPKVAKDTIFEPKVSPFVQDISLFLGIFPTFHHFLVWRKNHWPNYGRFPINKGNKYHTHESIVSACGAEGGVLEKKLQYLKNGNFLNKKFQFLRIVSFWKFPDFSLTFFEIFEIPWLFSKPGISLTFSWNSLTFPWPGNSLTFPWPLVTLC